MYQTNEQFESTITSQRGSLQGKEARAAYDEYHFDIEPSVDSGEWFSRPVSYKEYDTEEVIEIPTAALEDTSGICAWSSVFGIDLSACGIQNPIDIDMPPDDWSWCADPL
jgi:hypothetical protein